MHRDKTVKLYHTLYAWQHSICYDLYPFPFDIETTRVHLQSTIIVGMSSLYSMVGTVNFKTRKEE